MSALRLLPLLLCLSVASCSAYNTTLCSPPLGVRPSFEDKNAFTYIRFAGSAQFEPLMKSWFAGYITRKSSTDLAYESAQTDCAEAFLARDYVEAAFTEYPLEVSDSSSSLLADFPFAISASVLIVNVKNASDANYTLSLTLNRDIVAGIYNNSITVWNHTLIQEENPDVAEFLPNTSISVVAFSGESDMTKIHTGALAKFGWGLSSGEVVTFDHSLAAVTWNASDDTRRRWFLESSDEDVESRVLTTPDSIGYLSFGYGFTSTASYIAPMRNKAGIVQPFPNATLIAIALDNIRGWVESRDVADLTHGFIWPFLGFDYIILNKSSEFSNQRCKQRHELAKILNWIYSDPLPASRIQLYGLFGLSSSAKDTILKQLYSIQCNFTDGVKSIFYTTPRPQRVYPADAPIFAVSMTLFFISIILIGLTIRNAKSDSQGRPTLMLAILPSVGASISYISVIFWYILPVDTAICELRKWFTCIGVSLMLGALFTKTLQINAIYVFANRRMKNLTKGVKHMIIASAAMITVAVVQLIILAIWTGTDRWEARRIITDNIELIDELACVSRNGQLFGWLIVEIVFLGGMCLFAAVVVYRTWEMKQSVSESKFILLYSYFVLLNLALIIPWIFITQPDDNGIFYFASLSITLLTFITIITSHFSRMPRGGSKTHSSSGWASTNSRRSGP